MPGTQVSVVLPVKNGMPHLQSALAALCQQTYDAITLVVQDSTSTDGSLDCLRSLKAPFPVDIVSESDGSLVAGYNRALKRCAGDLVVPAACDEVMDNDAIERYVRWHEAHPDAVFVYGGMRLDDGRGGPLREYQPLPFNLLDYLRHRVGMTPPMAGAFDRRLLGAELRFDETLLTVPDFELLTRLALRFGPDRIVCEQGMTATARADTTSMTYRPDAYRQIVHDKTEIINRLLPERPAGRWFSRGPNHAFSAFLRRDVLSEMHLAFARHIYGLAGDCAEFRDQVIAAHSYMPASRAVEEEARKSRHFAIDARTHRLGVRPAVPPDAPPEELSEVVARMPPDLIQVEPGWALGGATQEVRENRAVVVTTSAEPWSYSAWARPDLGVLSGDRHWYWLRVRISRAEGAPMLSLYDSTRNTLRSEVSIAETATARDYYLELTDDVHRTVLLRNGPAASRAVIELAGFDLIRMPIPSSQNK